MSLLELHVRAWTTQKANPYIGDGACPDHFLHTPGVRVSPTTTGFFTTYIILGTEEA